MVVLSPAARQGSVRALYAPGMELPAGYRLRAPAPGDLDAVADVLIADELDGAGQIVLGTDFLRDEWSPVGVDLAADAWVVTGGAQAIVAYVQAMREEPALVAAWGVVHPGHRGRGIGSALVDLTEERASRLLAGQPVGALTGHVWDDRGWVDYLGVLAPGRGRGTGMALLRRSFATFAGRGVRRVILNVDAKNTTGATALYERAGMRVINRWDVWERLLGSSQGS
jgi:GNAT superfamily N-acetyltransferase